MKVLILQDEMFAYLNHIVRSYAQGGINPEEGLALFQLNESIKGAQAVSDEEIAKIKTGEVAGTPVASVKVAPAGRDDA